MKKFIKERFSKYKIVSRFRVTKFPYSEIVISFDTEIKPKISRYHLREKWDIMNVSYSCSWNSRVNSFCNETLISIKTYK